VLLRKKLLVVLAVTMLLAMSVASPAFAHHCTNVSKQPGAGSIGTVNIVTGEETFAKEHGGFVTVTDGSTFSYDVFANRTLPEGAMAAGPGGDSECDGVGVDDALACLGIEE
jgi:hypothetical protein